MHRWIHWRVTVYLTEDQDATESVLAEFENENEARAFRDWRAAQTLDDWSLGLYRRQGHRWIYQNSRDGLEPAEVQRRRLRDRLRDRILGPVVTEEVPS